MFAQIFQSYFGLVAVFVFAAMVLCVAAWVVFRMQQKLHIFEDALNVTRIGVVVFDEYRLLLTKNKKAQSCFSMLNKQAKGNLSLSDFLDHLFDHTADVDDDLSLMLMSSRFSTQAQLFREIVIAEDGRTYLAELQKTTHNRTVILLNDAHRLLEQEEHVQELHKINRELIQAIEASTCGVMVSDPKTNPHTILFANAACCTFFELKDNLINGQEVHQFFQTILHQDDEDTADHVFEGGISLQRDIKVDVGEAQKCFDLRLNPVFDAQGKIDLFLCVFTDITALKIREAEFFKAQKLDALGRLVAGVAHDFNNVLSIIDGYSRMIGNHPENHDETLNSVEKIQAASGRAAGLIRQMLTFSHHKVITDQIIDIKKELFNQESLLKPLMDVRVDLSVECGPGDLYTRCSVETITQIVLNLVINARDAIAGEGRINVSLQECKATKLPKKIRKASPDTEFLHLSVADTGGGMDQKTLARIFDPFFTTKDQGKGTGLGLSVVYGLIQDIHAHIDVESQIGQGTIFHLYIPRTYEEPQKQICGHLDNMDEIQLKGYTVLVAEDEPELRDILCGTLQERGLNVLAAKDGNDALVLQDDHDGEIDILLTDVVMPGVNGIKLAELIRSIRPNIHVIFMSGYPARHSMGSVDLPQDSFFMSKPIDYAALLRIMVACLEDSRNDTNSDDYAALNATVAQWKTQNVQEDKTA